MNSPLQIAKLSVIYGANKVQYPIVKSFILSIIGGFLVGAGAVVSTICGYNYIGGYAQFYSGLVFPIGIMAVYCAGAELITGNCLLIIPFLSSHITCIDMFLNWLIVFIGNFIGGILIALLVVYGHIPHMFDVDLARIFFEIGIEKCSFNFGEAVIRGLLCNFYECLAIWISMGGRDLRSVILGLWTPIFLFAACGLEHCVANVYYITSALFTSYEYGVNNYKLNWGRLFYKNIIPVTIGNILGGAGMVGLMHWYIYLCDNEPKDPKEPREQDYQNQNPDNSNVEIKNDSNTYNAFIN
jgi:formate/nitrite transporter